MTLSSVSTGVIIVPSLFIILANLGDWLFLREKVDDSLFALALDVVCESGRFEFRVLVFCKFDVLVLTVLKDLVGERIDDALDSAFTAETTFFGLLGKVLALAIGVGKLVIFLISLNQSIMSW